MGHQARPGVFHPVASAASSAGKLERFQSEARIG
jgi:hypothetical protein